MRNIAILAAIVLLAETAGSAASFGISHVTFSEIPEPAVFLVLGAALTALGALRRRT